MFFTKLDCIRAYHQILVDISKTAVTIPFGLFELLCVPFGQRTWHSDRFIDHVLHDLHFDCVYEDNILIASFSTEQYVPQKQLLSECFQKLGVFIKPSKCEFGQKKIRPIVMDV